MIEPDLFSVFIKPINRLPVRYMVTGAAAVIIYGEPRLTHDVDLVLEMAEKDVEALLVIFPKQSFYCPPKEVVRKELSRKTKGHFNIIHMETGFKADVYLAGSDDLHQWGMAHSQVFEINDVSVRMAPPEYVIIRKLEFYKEGGSEKHLDDIRGIVRISGKQLDNAVLAEKIRALGLESEWAKIEKRSSSS